MDIAEFLLARIAEDEERARKRMHHAQENHLLVQDPKYLGRVIPGWYEWPEIEADAARVLAECDAKRRIVAELDFEDFYLSDISERVATALALPYADHSDYQQRWTY